MTMIVKAVSGATMSKADELALLRTFMSKVPSGSYLSSLFGLDLLQWLERQMADDSNCNVVVMLQGAIERERQSAQIQVRDYVAEAGRAVGEARQLELKVKEQTGQIATLTKNLTTIGGKLEQERSELSREQEYGRVLRDENIELRSRNVDLQQSLRVSEGKVVLLQARLYEIEHPIEDGQAEQAAANQSSEIVELRAENRDLAGKVAQLLGDR